MLTVRQTLPERFLDTPAGELHRLLPGPTLIHLPGRRRTPLFVSVLLHGNEDTGVVALQNLLRAYARRPLPRALSLLVGNVAAARAGLRRLDQQPDYNRVWPGAERHTDSPEYAAMREVYDRMQARGVFASIDIHNNTGLNPHYAVVNRLDQEALHLALLFSRTVVWFRGLAGTQTTAFSSLCPALTIECGKPGRAANEAHATSFIEACLHLAQFPAHSVRESDIDLYHTVATVRVPPQTSFGFGDALADVDFDPQLDHMNFRQLDPGTVFGHTRLQLPIDVRDEGGQDVTAEFFDCSEGMIRLRRAATPAMLTLDERVVRQDCLCYLMERLPLPRRENAAPELCASL
ncbi:MAG: succinylglutamate desuccinylase/aspartoacylase family protein [Candidatus Accumulibacter sp.]|uniref:Succinylglutamate desuccinylase/aspartoacylase family protein n=1 Tax=Candidatus Accumulibacter affinis TaxID=2954384 RepID=A0A935TC69_9PROT|nr:succinylglutamate desuccinylase/aspartoacylase family protein [Candidatus Accumulibacter affinis]